MSRRTLLRPIALVHLVAAAVWHFSGQGAKRPRKPHRPPGYVLAPVLGAVMDEAADFGRQTDGHEAGMG